MGLKAPWPDFAGQPIYEHDIIQHPSGEEAEVLFVRSNARESDRWFAYYLNYGSLSRLCLQIGQKGRAVVIKRNRSVQSIESAVFNLDTNNPSYIGDKT